MAKDFNLFNFIQKYLGNKPQTISQDQLLSAQGDKNQFDMLRKFGIVQGDLRKALEAADMVNFERESLALACERSLVHSFMSGAAGITAEYCTVYNRINNATVWGTANNKQYQYQLDKFLDIINIEEIIYDMAWTLAVYGDHFIEVNGEPGVGIVSINDDFHPITISRLDAQQRLVGFYESGNSYMTSDRKLLPPWQFVHMRLLQNRRRRALYGNNDVNYSEYRTTNIMAPDIRRLTSKYGSGILAEALPTYKRLRLAEDSVMMGRITRGVLRNIWKIGIDKANSNNESISSILDGYTDILKSARSLNLDISSPSFNSKFNGMSNLEDLIIPVWGDVNQVQVDKIGGEIDLKWIADVDMLQKQLATALKIPLPLLSGFADQAGGMLGQNSLEKLDIRFARQARRLQRAVIVGLTRMFQIHLAYQGINPDPKLFKIHMSETSTAEELELQEALDKGVDVSTKVMEMLEKILGTDLNKEEAWKYLNERFLKLTDIDFDKFKLKGNDKAFSEQDNRLSFGEGGAGMSNLSSPNDNPFKAIGQNIPPEQETPEANINAGEPTAEEEVEPKITDSIHASDFKAMLPLREMKERWETQWGKTIIKIEENRK